MPASGHEAPTFLSRFFFRWERKSGTAAAAILNLEPKWLRNLNLAASRRVELSRVEGLPYPIGLAPTYRRVFRALAAGVLEGGRLDFFLFGGRPRPSFGCGRFFFVGMARSRRAEQTPARNGNRRHATDLEPVARPKWKT